MIHLMRFFIAGIGIVFAAACGASSPTKPTGGVRVSGRVLAFTTNTGMPGATVIFDPSLGSANDASVPGPGSITTLTDTSGVYILPLSAIGRYWTWVDGKFAGVNYVTGSAYRGDLFVPDGSTCVSRYGTITDASTKKAVSGASVSITVSPVTDTSGSDGWYRIDLGCPPSGMVGGNTTVLYIKHPSYADFITIVGRGVAGLQRLDVELQRK
jgi:hypothetical protein